MMKRVFLAVFLIIAVVLMPSLVAAAPGDNAKGPPVLEKVVFVHYPKGEPAKGGIPGPPPGGGENGGGRLYSWDGTRWADSSLPVVYWVNLGGNPTTFLTGIQAGFQTWEDDPGSSMDFTYGGAGGYPISSLNNQMDGLNVVGWAYISDVFPGAIAVTWVWRYITTKEIVEVDMALNSDSAFAWHQNSVTGDPDTASWTASTTTAYDVDVQNIVAHEAGHWLMLGDLYNKPANQQTMFGRGPEYELKKRSLESGDEAGIRVIYPMP